MKDTIVCDLDGTLANCEHRVHHVQRTDNGGLRRKPDWDAFYAGVREDTVNFPVLHLLQTYLSEEWYDYRVVFCTGRPERCRADTIWWLRSLGDEYLWPDPVQLLMRADGDYRADYIVKQEILDKHIDKERVLFVLDDRQQVVDMWRRNGLTCFQVAEGDF